MVETNRGRWGWQSLKRNIGGRMRNWGLCSAGLLLTLLMGCATTQPRIEGKRYTNSEFGFSAEIPTGWRSYERIPDDIQQAAGVNFPQDLQGPFLFNASTDGVIHFFGLTMDGNWSDFDDMSESQKQEVASALVDAVLKGVTFPLTGHNRYEGGLSTTHANWRRNNSNFKPVKMVDYSYQSRETTGYNYIYGESVLYPCFTDKTCTLMLMLGSKHGRQCRDMASFCAFVSSIKAHDIPDN